MHCGSFSAKGTRLVHQIKGPMEGAIFTIKSWMKTSSSHLSTIKQSSSGDAKTVWRHNSVPDYFGYYGDS